MRREWRIARPPDPLNVLHGNRDTYPLVPPPFVALTDIGGTDPADISADCSSSPNGPNSYRAAA
jgi:hypothetical protein